MPRRVSLPGADELFRATTIDGASRPAPADSGTAELAAETGSGDTSARAEGQAPGRHGREVGRPSGRQRHEEKITVYVSPEELIELERCRLTLRSNHRLAVDRGRIVREALSVVLADLEAKGDSSILVRRLRG